MILNNRQHEEFCHAIVAGSNLTEAARCAGYAEGGAGNVGSRLAKLSAVQTRIAELRHERDARENKNDLVTRGYIVSQTILVHRKALKAKQYAVNVACLQFLAKLGGYLVDHKTSYSERVNIHQVRTDQLAALLARDAQQLPEAQRVELLESDPELAGLLDTPAQGVQSPQAADSGSSD